MNEISCGLCMDLMPLVADGVAGEDSVKAVKQHMESCEACRAAFHDAAPPKADPDAAFTKVKKKMQLFWTMLLMFGVLYGLSLTSGDKLFYNIILMPMIGALGYGLLRKKAFWEIPVLLYITHIITNFLGLGGEVLDFWTLIWWTFYYCLFALLGIVIAWLVHFALRKEP